MLKYIFKIYKKKKRSDYCFYVNYNYLSNTYQKMLSVYGTAIDIFFILSGLKLKINVDKGFGLT